MISITISGAAGTGKSTLALAIAQDLRIRGFDAEITALSDDEAEALKASFGVRVTALQQRGEPIRITEHQAPGGSLMESLKATQKSVSEASPEDKERYLAHAIALGKSAPTLTKLEQTALCVALESMRDDLALLVESAPLDERPELRERLTAVEGLLPVVIVDLDTRPPDQEGIYVGVDFDGEEAAVVVRYLDFAETPGFVCTRKTSAKDHVSYYFRTGEPIEKVLRCWRRVDLSGIFTETVLTEQQHG